MKSSRPILIGTLVVLLGLTAIWFLRPTSPDRSASSPASANPELQRLVLISLDTTRADRLGSYGHLGAFTPHLDRLARQSLVFTDVLTEAPLTAPAHASLLTGEPISVHGVAANGYRRLPADLPTLASRLGDADWQTGGFVSAAVLDRNFGFDSGFDHYDDGPLAEGEERPAAETVERSLAWLAERLPSDRWFLFSHLYDPHHPWRARPPWARLGDPYDGEVAQTDAAVGRLLAGLRRFGSGTGIAVVGDHGEALGDHGEETHGTLLRQPTVRIPFLARLPGREPAIVSEPFAIRDLGMALAAEAGATSSSPGLLDSVREVRTFSAESTAAMYGWAPLHGVLRGHHKLVRGARAELYDLLADPEETTDISEREPTLTQELLALIEAGPDRPPELVEERERLAALGYVLPGPITSRPGAPDPRDMIAFAPPLESLVRACERDGPHRHLQHIESLLAEDPGNRALLHLKGRALLISGRLPEAAEAFTRAVDAGGPPEVVFDAAITEARLGHRGKALELLQSLHNLPTAQIAHRAEILARMGFVNEALDSLSVLDERDPQHWQKVVQILLGARRPAEAAQAAREGACWLDTPESWILLGRVLSFGDRPEEAIEAFRRAPFSGESHLVSGLLLLRLDRDEEALQEMLTAWHMWPGRPRSAFGLGFALEELGRDEEAEQLHWLGFRGSPNAAELQASMAMIIGKRRSEPPALDPQLP